jgi:hypothetical protein
MPRTFASALLGLACLLSAGCSSFHQHWKSAVNQPLPHHDMSGSWEGRWVSEKNGHNGRLRCVMSQTGTNLYEARFHAIYWKIFRAAYEVPFEATRAGDRFTFSGESNLGKLAGGVYSYHGAATPSVFEATYRSKYDHGRFEMTRPRPD